MNDKIVSTVLHVVEDESAKAAVAEELKVEDGDIKKLLKDKGKAKAREDSKRNVGGGGIGGHR